MKQETTDPQTDSRDPPPVTWFFVAVSILPLLGVTFAIATVSLQASEVYRLILGMAVPLAVGLFIGYKVAPLSEAAGLAVISAPFISLAALWATGIMLSLAYGDKHVVRGLVLLTPFLAVLSIPAAGIARLVHYLRDSRS